MATSPHEAELLIDKAVRAMHELPVPKGPPADVVEKVRLLGATATGRHTDSMERAIEGVRSTLDAASSSSIPVTAFSSFGAKLMRPRNLVGIAVAVAVIFFAAQWIPSSSNGNLAFAQMQQLVAKTKSVQYTEVRTDRFGKSTSETRAKVKVLGTSIERREVTNKEENLPEGSISTTALGSYISINDAKQGKIITLYPDKRAFVMIRGTMSVTDDGQVKSEPTKADPKADFYARISEVPIDPMKRLPERMIDGKKAVGFVVEEKREGQNNVDIFHRTYWIDPVTKLPIRIEATFRSTRPDSVESDWVKSDFVFDAQLDEALFSLAPPPGYTEIGKPDGNAKPTVPPGKPGG